MQSTAEERGRCSSQGSLQTEQSRVQYSVYSRVEERGSCARKAAHKLHKMPITATQLWVVPPLSLSLSLSLRLEIAHNYHCREDDNDNEDAQQRDVGEDVGKVDFSQQLAGTL